MNTRHATADAFTDIPPFLQRPLPAARLVMHLLEIDGEFFTIWPQQMWNPQQGHFVRTIKNGPFPDQETALMAAAGHWLETDHAKETM